MESHTVFAALRDALAGIYSEEQDARVIATNAGLDLIKITFSARSQTNWHNILAEAILVDCFDPLLQVALSIYSNNMTLLAAYTQYRLFADCGHRLQAPDPLPTTGSIVQTIDTGGGAAIGGDVNVEQRDFVWGNKNVRSISIGRDGIRSLLITGDHNQVFIGDYERLQDAYINTSLVFARVNLDHFTGREWLLAEVDEFLQFHNRDYFILAADAGLGKTTFMAWLAKQRHYIHHFSELAPGREGIGPALHNLVAQLALAYKLRPDGVLPNAATRPDYLYDLLKQAANRRRQGEKIVLVVDALDEAGTLPKQNVLGLPSGTGACPIFTSG